MKARKKHLIAAAIMLLLSILCWTTQISADGIVAGYYPCWLRSMLPADKIKFENLSHIIHAFAWPNANGSITANIDLNHPQLIAQTHAAGKKITLALGGWGNSSGFSPMAANSALRATFIANIIKFCQERGYDGVDIDWEYPQTTADRDNLNLLVIELRQAFNNVNKNWIISMAVPAGAYNGQWFDFTILKKYIDWFGCMTYDFMGSWVTTAYHNSPLYPPQSSTEGSVHTGIQYLNITRGIPKQQILLGIPFYGRGCNAVGLFQPHTGGDAEYYYSQVVPKIGNGWTYFWDDICKVPYLMNTGSTKYITFDDTTSVRLKCEYCTKNGLAGVMIWALGQDLLGFSQPLLQTIGRSMGFTSGIVAYHQQKLSSFSLLNNYPNPFNGNTVIRFYLEKQDDVKLEVFDIEGRQITLLIDQWQPQGWHEVQFNSNNIPSGIYIYKLSCAAFSRAEKMTILK
jgi:GH18 family chitinase